MVEVYSAPRSGWEARLEHDAVVPLLLDLIQGRLDHEPSAGAWRHVSSCSECQGVIATTHRVVAGVTRHGAALFEDHPPADDLVRYAAAPPELSIQQLAVMREHVEGCPDCREELEFARRAHSDRPPAGSWGSGIRGLRGAPIWGRLAPAFAVLVALLGYPAYRGLVELPRLERSNATFERRVTALEGEQRPALPPQPGGAVRLLYLTGATRASSAPPTITVGPGQPYQPVVLELEPDPSLLAREASVVLRNLPGGEAAWSLRAPLADLWDPSNRAISLIIPRDVFRPGDYEIELRTTGETPHFVSRFRVR